MGPFDLSVFLEDARLVLRGDADAGVGHGENHGTVWTRDGGRQTRVLRSGPGVYQLEVSPGGDTARWSMWIEDYY